MLIWLNVEQGYLLVRLVEVSVTMMKVVDPKETGTEVCVQDLMLQVLTVHWNQW